MVGVATERPGRLAALAVAPTVYLGATERGGYAIVVGPDGVPTWILLPDADADALDRQLAVLAAVPRLPRVAAEPGGGGRIGRVLEWAWDAIMAPLLGR